MMSKLRAELRLKSYTVDGTQRASVSKKKLLSKLKTDVHPKIHLLFDSIEKEKEAVVSGSLSKYISHVAQSTEVAQEIVESLDSFEFDKYTIGLGIRSQALEKEVDYFLAKTVFGSKRLRTMESSEHDLEKSVHFMGPGHGGSLPLMDSFSLATRGTMSDLVFSRQVSDESPLILYLSEERILAEPDLLKLSRESATLRLTTIGNQTRFRTSLKPAHLPLEFFLGGFPHLYQIAIFDLMKLGFETISVSGITHFVPRNYGEQEIYVGLANQVGRVTRAHHSPVENFLFAKALTRVSNLVMTDNQKRIESLPVEEYLSELHIWN